MDIIHVSSDREGNPHEAMCLCCSSIWRRLGLAGYPNTIPFDHWRRKHEQCGAELANALDAVTPDHGGINGF